MQLSISKKVLLLVAIPLCTELLFIFVLGLLLKQSEIETARSERSRAIVGSASNLTKVTFDACANLIAYNLSKGPLFSDGYQRCVSQIPLELNLLGKLIGDDKEEQASLARVREISDRGVKLFAEAKQAADESDMAANLISATTRSEIEEIASNLTSELDKLVDRERARNNQRPEAEIEARKMVEYAIICGIVLNLAVAWCLTVYLNSSITNRLKLLVDNTRRLADGEPLAPPVGDDDEITHLDQTFREMANALTESNRLKQEFLEMVSHDVRTPLTSVATSLSLIEMGAHEEKRSSYVARAHKNIDQVLALLNQLLDVHRIEANKFDIDVVDTGIAEVLAEAIDTIAATAEKSSISIVAAENPVTVRCDPERMAQVFINLLSNALKYSPKGSTIVTTIDSSADGVTIGIRDQGPGVPDEFKTKIFDRFQQIRRTDETTHGGRGLGLAICKAIVEKHGGRIAVEDAEGGGSRFVIWLPLSTNPQ